MPSPRLELRTLRPEDERSFRRAVDEFRQDDPEWRFAFEFDPAADFARYVGLLDDWSHGRRLPEKFVPNTFLVGVVDGAVVGRLSLRHTLNDFLRRIGGHIGYGVVPSQRRRGHATAMLRQALPHCAALGLERVLVTCDVDNVASRKVIENCGGVCEGLADGPGLPVPKRRYWIAVANSG